MTPAIETVEALRNLIGRGAMTGRLDWAGEAGYVRGQCRVKDWRAEERDNPHVASALSQADSIMALLSASGLVIMPREPTKAMLDAAEEMHMPFGEMVAAWDGFVMASPFASAAQGEGGE